MRPAVRPAMRMRRRRGRALALLFGEAVRVVAQDYANFVRAMAERGTDEDPRLFGARHAAARACLGHLEELLGLAGEEAGLEPARDGLALLEEAQRALGPPPPPGEDASHDGPGTG